MTPDANDLCVFAVKRGGIQKRIDVKNVLFNRAICGASSKTIPLGKLCLEEPCYGTSAIAIERTDEKQPKYIRITDFDDYGIQDEHQYMTAETYSEKHMLQPNDILFARTGGTVGKTYFYDGKIGKAIFAGYCIRFRFDSKKVVPKFVYWYTKTKIYQDWVKGIQRPAGQPNINKEEYKSFEIVLPDVKIQNILVDELNQAQNRRMQLLDKSSNMIFNFKNEIEKMFDLPTDSLNRLCFAILLRDLDGVIDAKRYASMTNHTSKFKISDVCDVVDEKVNVSRFDKQIIDWIRIDDLPNQPLDIETVRTQPANEVDGTFFEVQEGDILVARLGPTILNQKIVMVRSIKRTTIASAEFLVLRCKSGYDPEAVMAVLNTGYYKDLMYAHARGSTPSRYRLNRDDMLKLPFPDIRKYQVQIADDANNVREQVKAMRIHAEKEWQVAKERFERELLGE